MAFLNANETTCPSKTTHFSTHPVPLILNLPPFTAVLPSLSWNGLHVIKSDLLTKQWSLQAESVKVMTWQGKSIV